MHINNKRKERKMALDKAIAHGREHRKLYRGSKRVDRTCRNHGSCVWCRNGRMYAERRELEKIRYKLHESEQSNWTAKVAGDE